MLSLTLIYGYVLDYMKNEIHGQAYGRGSVMNQKSYPKFRNAWAWVYIRQWRTLHLTENTIRIIIGDLAPNWHLICSLCRMNIRPSHPAIIIVTDTHWIGYWRLLPYHGISNLEGLLPYFPTEKYDLSLLLVEQSKLLSITSAVLFYGLSQVEALSQHTIVGILCVKENKDGAL